MDKFGKLSIDDELDRTIREEDLVRLSNLSISDEIGRMSPQVFTKYMPHSPVCPSPLRHAMQLDPLGDKMDVDELIDEEANAEGEGEGVDTRIVQRSQDILEEGDMQRDVQEASPTPSPTKQVSKEKSSQDNNTAKNHDDVMKEEVSELDESDSKEDEESVHRGAVIRALLSPTSLGVAAAAKIDGIPIESPAQASKPAPKEVLNTDRKASDANVTGIDFTDLKDELRWRSRSQPIQVSINHHHYYPNTDGYRPFVQDWSRPVESEYDEPYKLPVPWSSNCKPVSKNSYTFVSYLQLFLNFITVVVLFSFVTSLVRSLKTDITSSWNHKRLELEYESINCKNLYAINECTLRNKPALQGQCEQWERCMNKDNDLFFRARTTLGARLFGEVINSFVEPIGWKALLVVMLGLAIWCFSSNFLLGYMRAKSYYGDANQQYLLQQRRQLFLKDEDRANRELSLRSDNT
ncbi:hypothetical protein ZYGR_0AD04670 [Zygosaccharomyces rouxii]|uniref:ZYRO0G16896p n=2 Tax=Zygosaccharomyces rouxii TaxID=4956 RepID=C5E0Z9_ZYGRC|nr:uncharacterized protein ZYRO0G16896g [Zygosaccharomyces rouxii]KAH9202776.1 Di-sulfide bridge nucleocytoplasmic transport domain-containing protein [Zygosaccharomyces rouxii]GAV51284.1 hypothetical protein ZYGR_0AD04670 [Zygosaccharomyces rouxii]CAR29783.1 ZYRO0G16896p [Zygosaccharomyces rouxii]